MGPVAGPRACVPGVGLRVSSKASGKASGKAYDLRNPRAATNILSMAAEPPTSQKADRESSRFATPGDPDESTPVTAPADDQNKDGEIHADGAEGPSDPKVKEAKKKVEKVAEDDSAGEGSPEEGKRPTERVFDGQIRPPLRGAWLDTAFFVLGGIEAVWFAVLLFDKSFGAGWSLLLLIPFWVVTAYITLPRLHRILTAVYVPDYFFGRTRTSEGMLGDPVNLAFNGTAAQIHAAMTEAGWTLADEVNLKSSWKIVVSSVLRRSYPTAPVSPLFLFGRKQDLAYQQEVAGNPLQRHHVRFWRCPDGWLLPGGRRVGWLGAGTFDTAVGLSLFTLQITHRIDANIDVERDYIVKSLTDGCCDDVSVSLIHDFSSGYHHRNGGGDRVHTDGDLPVVDLEKVEAKKPTELPEQVCVAARGYRIPDGPFASPDPGASMEQKLTVGGSTVRRPNMVKVALAMLIISLSAQVAVLIRSFLSGNPTPVAVTGTSDFIVPLEYLTLAMSLVIGGLVVTAALTVLTLLGFQMPRVLLMALVGGMVLFKLADGTMPDPGQLTVHLLITSVNLLALLALSSDEVRIWSRRGKPSWRDHPDTYDEDCCTKE